MLTQQTVLDRLNIIADEISRAPGMYYELYSRLFSERVKSWMKSVPVADASVIEHVAANDPDYLPGVEVSVSRAREYWTFNPAWDMEYD